jgi:hypothetical protein
MRPFPTKPVLLQPTKDSKRYDETREESKQEANKNKRRSKNDPNGRTYICGCGKMYLSYPALYTHIKGKHDGINPEGTNAPQFKNGRGRGRPRKIKETTEPIKAVIAHPSDNIRQNPNFADEISYMREIGQYSDEGTDPLAGFPSLYYKNEEMEHPLISVIRSELDMYKKARDNIPFDEPVLNCNRIFAKFLIEHASVTQASFYKSIVMLICLLYKFLNEEEKEGFTFEENCEEVPCYIDSFLKFLSKHNIELDQDSFNSLLKHFLEWLYTHGYTHIRVQI